VLEKVLEKVEEENKEKSPKECLEICLKWHLKIFKNNKFKNYGLHRDQLSLMVILN